MKFKYGFILLAILAVVMLGPSKPVQAQSELVVEWFDANSGEVIVNALRDAIEQDTERPDDRVYVLKAGGYYWLTDRINNNDFHLRIYGEEPGITLQTAPAVIQMVENAEGAVSGRIFSGGSSMTLKNLWITGQDGAGTQTYYQPCQIDGSNSRYVIENCVIERTNFSMFAFTGTGNTIILRNNVYRNLVGNPSTQQWEGRGVSIWADQDSVILENNTFFNVGMCVLQIEGGAADYVRFVHNTMVNVGRAVNAGGWWRDAYFANNLFVNSWWHGEGYIDYSSSGRDPRSYNSGVIGVAPLPSMYGPEEGRRFLFTKAANYLDPAFTAYYADSIRIPAFCDPVSREDFIDVYPNMVFSDTTWLTAEPGIPSYADIQANIPNMIQNIEDLRAGVTPATPYYLYEANSAFEIRWPLPENFAYTSALTGTDGLPLGDLNWFPASLADYEANMDTYVAAIENMAGPRISFEISNEVEAEDGTVGGDAAVTEFQGFSYFIMDTGTIEWQFELANAGQYDLDVWTHLRGNNTRGQRIIVNGVSIHDPMGWGEYIWSANEQAANIWYGRIPNNEWVWTLITQAEILEAGALTLPAGLNTIRIESSWGYQNFAGINVIDFNSREVAAELRAPNATSYTVVTPAAEGAPWVPAKFKSVNLGTNGSVSWAIDVAEAGTYRVQVFYQNIGTPQTAQISVGGSNVASVDFAVDPDSAGANVMSSDIDLPAGTSTIAISGAGANVDFIQLLKVTVSGLEEAQLPEGYSLSQNYPNPFNPATKINFSLGKASNVKLVVYNILGQRVATLVNGFMPGGAHQVSFDARHLSSGVYFYGLETEDFTFYKKMMLLK